SFQEGARERLKKKWDDAQKGNAPDPKQEWAGKLMTEIEHMANGDGTQGIFGPTGNVYEKGKWTTKDQGVNSQLWVQTVDTQTAMRSWLAEHPEADAQKALDHLATIVRNPALINPTRYLNTVGPSP